MSGMSESTIAGTPQPYDPTAAYEYDSEGRLLGPKRTPEAIAQRHSVPVEQPRPKVKLKFEAAEGSRVASLLARLPRLEAQKREAEDDLDECKRAIMSEVASTVDDPEHMPDGWTIAEDPNGGWPAYNLTSNPGKLGLDTDALKTEEPDTYDRFVKRGKPYWSLSRVQRNRVKR